VDPILPLELALPEEHAPDPDLEAVLAAIDLVGLGRARRVRVSGMRSIETAAAGGLAHAQAAGVRFALERDFAGGATIVVGPLL
jgi:hypothetical protein